MKNTLKPCPFCGRIPEIVYDEDFSSYVIYHHPVDDDDNCPIVEEDEPIGMWGYDTEEEAAEAWNRRA